MSGGAAFGSERDLVGLVAAGDVDAVSAVYDRHASAVREYCAELLPPELVEEATFAGFVDFLGRAQRADPDGDADQLVRRAARTAAAARLDVPDSESAACRAVPELLAVRANGELARDDEALQAHLEGCSTCRGLADSLANAEDAFRRRPHGDPPATLREEWIKLASAKPPPVPEPKPVKEPEAPSSEGDMPEAPPPVLPARRRARRGGLVGTTRRIVSSARRR